MYSGAHSCTTAKFHSTDTKSSRFASTLCVPKHREALLYLLLHSRLYAGKEA